MGKVGRTLPGLCVMTNDHDIGDALDNTGTGAAAVLIMLLFMLIFRTG